MSDPGSPKMQCDVVSLRLSAQASESRCKDAVITLDTDLAGNRQAFNQAELLLAARPACMIKSLERVMPILKFSLHGVRRDVPPRLESISYEIVVDTDEPELRLDLLHANVPKYGTVFNTIAPRAELSGVLRRKASP